MAPDVGTLDIPTSPYRPDPEVGVEVSDAIVTGHPDLDDSMRSIRNPRIIFNTHYYNNKKVCLTIHISAVLLRV